MIFSYKTDYNSVSTYAFVFYFFSIIRINYIIFTIVLSYYLHLIKTQMKNSILIKALPYIHKTSKSQLIIAGIVIVAGLCTFIYNYFFLHFSFKEQWANWIEVYATAALIFISITIWYNEKVENWRDSLPKKLKIQYFLKGDLENPYCTVLNAPLTQEGDIRQWGQSIAKTILNKKETVNVNFYGYEISNGIISEDRKTVEYLLKVFLREEIHKDIPKGKQFMFNSLGCLEE